MRRTTSCCSDSNDVDNDDSAGSAMPTSIPHQVPLCLEPITTRDRVMPRASYANRRKSENQSWYILANISCKDDATK